MGSFDTIRESGCVRRGGGGDGGVVAGGVGFVGRSLVFGVFGVVFEIIIVAAVGKVVLGAFSVAASRTPLLLIVVFFVFVA